MNMGLNWKQATSKGLTGLSKYLYAKAENTWEREMKEAEFIQQQNMENLRASNARQLQSEHHGFLSSLEKDKAEIQAKRWETEDEFTDRRLKKEEAAQKSTAKYQSGMLGLAESTEARIAGQEVVPDAYSEDLQPLTKSQYKQLKESGGTILNGKQKAVLEGTQKVDVQYEVLAYDNGKKAKLYAENAKKKGDKRPTHELEAEYLDRQLGLTGEKALSEESRVKLLQKAGDMAKDKMASPDWEEYKLGVGAMYKKKGVIIPPEQLDEVAQKQYMNSTYMSLADAADSTTSFDEMYYGNKANFKKAVSATQDAVNERGMDAVKAEMKEEGVSDSMISKIFAEIKPPEVQASVLKSKPKENVYSLGNIPKNFEFAKKRREEEDLKAYGSMPGK